MAEKIKVSQDSRFKTEISAADPEGDADSMHRVKRLHELTPYGMLLASLGSCTTIVLHTYARAHDVSLDRASVSVEYRRSFKEDCENCEGRDKYVDAIHESLELEGDLTDEQRRKLEHVAGLCSIRKILERGIDVKSDDA